MALLLVSSVIAFGYIVYSLAMGIPVSLSATYYTLGSKGWLFQLCMGIVSLTLAPVWMSLSSPECQCLPYLACGGLLFVAGAPCFKLELQGKVHYSSAIICCIASVMWQILEGLWDVTVWCAIIGGMLSLQWRRQWCWWMECAVIASVYMNLWRIV